MAITFHLPFQLLQQVYLVSTKTTCMIYFHFNKLPACICLIASFLFFAACKPSGSTVKAPEDTLAENTSELVFELENFIESSEGFTLASNGKALVSPDESDSWVSFEANIPQAGRYQVEVVASGVEKGSAHVWLEDYIGNKDGRTYNVTSNISLEAGASPKVILTGSKDGSPLNSGTHPMKLHKSGAGVHLDKVRLTLIRARRPTPKLMTQQMDGKNWEVVWSDEFDGTGTPDTSKWTYDVGDWGWGNNELQYYTVARPKNSRMEDGNLIIESHKNDDGHAWTSARLTTRGKVSFLYGKIEFRAKVPTNRGNWAAGWTLGDNYVDEISWPYCGEIDILESVGFEMDDETGDGKAHASIHCGAYYFKLGNQPTATIDVKNMHEAFHTYAVVWTPEKITAYVDDQAYFEYNDTSTELAWPYDKAQNIILNLAMGGGWGGAQGMDETMTSQQFIIDYVRVYARKN